ncbi:hypothetical protein PUNSTDRAFT_107540 [Punctularia strigosozonata HHB-11173 SS5]|uniref:Pentacotripeptide-repeat region of PRORP domain-containing protein n=1 Tax=Punctularia strigosozonata (strain HHB-11173) TaxID=741275 RepID=R7S4W2_PUNST|nr:uncharacterized protein PUNSTDRAFT_107540 [Punctularia strigosozonata HHB-11173 SS5]EIN05268.1 hypothetical protein PUNSTDRAFT_107540 [Punctularia strigosozonata HHB-11173 SS5]
MRNLLRRLPNGAANSSTPKQGFQSAVRPRRPTVFKKLPSTWVSARGLDRPINEFTRLVHRQTRDEAWFMANRVIRANKMLARHRAMRDANVDSAEWWRWKAVVFTKDMQHALSELSRMGIEVQGDVSAVIEWGRRPMPQWKNPVQDPPAWIVIHLLSTKVHTPEHARQAYSLAAYCIPSLSPSIRPSLLVLVAHHLARFGLLPPLRALVTSFLTETISQPTFHFNSLLRALSRLHASPASAKLSVTILETMTSRKLRLYPHTYNALLSDRYLTVELTRMLRDRMKAEGTEPSRKHLEAYLRVFATHGAIHDAERFREAVRQLDKDRRSRRRRRSHADEEDRTVRRSDTMYLRALQNDKASAFRYLHDLAAIEQRNSATLSAKATALARRAAKFKNRPRTNSPRVLSKNKRSLDIYDWTTALYVASCDKSTPGRELLRLFDFAQTRGGVFTPTVATYTTLIKGLLERQELGPALEMWSRLRQSKLRLDKHSIAVGVQLLTESGHLARAWRLLEAAFTANNKLVNLTTVNGFMQSLSAVGRPDVVFALWDHMTALFDLRPDAVTLDILLDAARRAARFDDTITGALANLQLKMPFRQRSELPFGPNSTRSHSVDAIDALFKDGAKVTGLWRDVPAWQRARQIFRQVVLGNWPKLMAVSPPAMPVRPSGEYSSLGIREIASAFVGPSSGNAKGPTVRPPYLPAMQHLALQGLYPLGAYPHIYPTDRTFRAYIRLMGARVYAGDGVEYASEIPLALAWMREMEVKCSKETLALVTVLWAEVGMRAPLVENWLARKGGPGVDERSEYAKLMAWMKEWVGQEGMPSERDVGKWIAVLSQGSD